MPALAPKCLPYWAPAGAELPGCRVCAPQSGAVQLAWRWVRMNCRAQAVRSTISPPPPPPPRPPLDMRLLAAPRRFDADGRAELFSLINQHPTVYEVVTGRVARNKVWHAGKATERHAHGGGRDMRVCCAPHACALQPIVVRDVSGHCLKQGLAGPSRLWPGRAPGPSLWWPASSRWADPPASLPRHAQRTWPSPSPSQMYKRKIPKQQAAAAHAAVASQAAALAAFEEPNPFVRPGYQAADQVGANAAGHEPCAFMQRQASCLLACWRATGRVPWPRPASPSCPHGSHPACTWNHVT